MEPERRTAEPPLTRRQQIVIAAIGVVIGAIGVPIVISPWSPTWFAAVWAIAYVALGIIFLLLGERQPRPLVQQLSSGAIGALFAAQFVAALVFSDDDAHFWMATVLVLLFTLYSIVTLPFLEVSEWRWGVGIACATLFIGSFFRLHPVVAISFGIFCLVVIEGADRMRSLKRSLQTQLSVVGSMVHHDELTGLLNRRGLRFELEQTVATGSTIVLFDIDRFKQINDTHGYEVGDQVLTQLGEVLFRRLPEDFVVGRQAGDEFVAIAPGRVEVPDGVFDPIPVTVRLRGTQLPLLIDVSVGVTSGRAGESVDRALSQATFALREAKRNGDGFSQFGPTLQERFDRSLQLASLPAGRSVHGRLVSVGQPIVTDGGAAGVEMLVRWQRPDGTMLAPDTFLPMAVEMGMMPWINDLMLEQAVRYAARFNDDPNPPFVSVNITASHLAADDLGLRIYDLLERHEVAPSRLMIEITESEYLDGTWPWWSTATYLRDLGVKLAVDDFGSGYSSIERLRHVPLTHLKFDRTLVKSMDGPFGEIVRGVAQFAHDSDIGIIAEGIETPGELDSMRAIGIRLFQGFLYGRPCELDDLEHALRAGVDLRERQRAQAG